MLQLNRTLNIYGVKINNFKILEWFIHVSDERICVDMNVLLTVHTITHVSCGWNFTFHWYLSLVLWYSVRGGSELQTSCVAGWAAVVICDCGLGITVHMLVALTSVGFNSIHTHIMAAHPHLRKFECQWCLCFAKLICMIFDRSVCVETGGPFCHW